MLIGHDIAPSVEQADQVIAFQVLALKVDSFDERNCLRLQGLKPMTPAANLSMVNNFNRGRS